ncbi:RHS repeat-associated core domain-containing protein [Armatimonadetes bacterium GXS]|nr:RHS repeat-associated core domain-containing protein [Armatimonadetes bacterium GXS]
MIDGLGHGRALVSPSGVITDRYTYDSWGNLIEQAGNTPNPFTWNGAYGYEFIPFTGLYHVGAREYDPRTARWLQRDPIDVAGGHPNVYVYCLNNPINLTDPAGLGPVDEDLSELIHFLLDIIGFFPGAGEPADLANAGLYLARLDIKNALISAAGVIPGLGDTLKLGRFARHISRILGLNIGDVAKFCGRLIEAAGKVSKYLGEYGKVGGHHIFIKSAFTGHPNYDPEKALSISHAYMKERGWDHARITGAQRRLISQISKQKGNLSFLDHIRIAYQSLLAGGVPVEEAVAIVIYATIDMLRCGVIEPVRIPWR